MIKPLLKPSQQPRKRKKNHSRKNATRARHKMINDLDAIARAEVFARDDGRCIRCENPDRSVQWAHVLSRRHPCLRWEADNAMSLCAGCHLKWHHEPALSVEWYIDHFPERWRRIKAVLLLNPKVNVKEMWEARRAQ